MMKINFNKIYLFFLVVILLVTFIDISFCDGIGCGHTAWLDKHKHSVGLNCHKDSFPTGAKFSFVSSLFRAPWDPPIPQNLFFVKNTTYDRIICSSSPKIFFDASVTIPESPTVGIITYPNDLSDGDWCGSATFGGGLGVYYLGCSEQFAYDRIAWDSSSRSCTRCTTSFELYEGSSSNMIFEHSRLWTENVGSLMSTSSEGRTITNILYYLGGGSDLGYYKYPVSSGCAEKYSNLDVYWCDGYFTFRKDEYISPFYEGKGIFRPNQYRRILYNDIMEVGSGDDYRDNFDYFRYSEYYSSDLLPPIANDCLTFDEYGFGKCASYCDVNGSLKPMQCVDDRECPDVFYVSKKPGGNPLFPSYEILMTTRNCTKRIPGTCVVQDDELSLEDPSDPKSRMACIVYGGQIVKAGSAGVGSYPRDNTDAERCCGNDVFQDGTPKEFVRYRVVVGASSDYDDVACCGDVTNCVFDGKCYRQNQKAPELIEDKEAYCYNGVWIAQQVSLYFGYPSYTELPKCGDFICDLSSGENCFTCPEDCSVEAEFGTKENFEEVIMHKGDKEYYPSNVSSSDQNTFNSVSYALTWYDQITCEAYSKSKYKSAYGWGMKKANYFPKPELNYCDSRTSSDCGNMYYYFVYDGESGVYYVRVTAYSGDKVTIFTEEEDEEGGPTIKKQETFVMHYYLDDADSYERYVTSFPDVMYYIPQGDISYLTKVKYIQNPLTVMPTCVFDSECMSNNCAKFGKVGMCCPYGYIYNGNECAQKKSFTGVDYGI